MLSDIDIAQKAQLQKIGDLAMERLGIAAEHLVPYGHYKAKVTLDYLRTLEDRPDGKLILVTAISPTPAGEGKTTTTVGPVLQGLEIVQRDLGFVVPIGHEMFRGNSKALHGEIADFL